MSCPDTDAAHRRRARRNLREWHLTLGGLSGAAPLKGRLTTASCLSQGRSDLRRIGMHL